MFIRKWHDLPENMKNESVKSYYEILYKKRYSLIAKRVFDVVVAIILLIVFSPLFIIISLAIKIDSEGPIMFRQIRVTQCGRKFKIYKFRTMVKSAEKLGTQVTTKNDSRVTRVGKLLRKLRFDEIPQLINIIVGDMSFVGTRPEVAKYVEKYTDEMMATLLLPAGVTSEASIKFKDEELLLENADDIDETYVNEVLPRKMDYNLKSLKEYSFFSDIKTMFRTVAAVFKNDTKSNVKVEEKSECSVG